MSAKEDGCHRNRLIAFAWVISKSVPAFTAHSCADTVISNHCDEIYILLRNCLA